MYACVKDRERHSATALTVIDFAEARPSVAVGMDEVFDVVVESSVEGVRKPSKFTELRPTPVLTWCSF